MMQTDHLLSHTLAVSSLLLAPYLPLSNEIPIREWRLVPFNSIREAQIVPQAVARPVERLIAAYGRGDRMGAVIHQDGKRVGAEFEMRDFMRLRAALLAGSLAGNPPMLPPRTTGWTPGR